MIYCNNAFIKATCINESLRLNINVKHLDNADQDMDLKIHEFFCNWYSRPQKKVIVNAYASYKSEDNNSPKRKYS